MRRTVKDFDGATGSFDLCLGAGGDRVGLDRELQGEIAGAQDLDAHARLGDEAASDQRRGINHSARFETLGDPAEVDDGVVDAEVEVAEATLGLRARGSWPPSKPGRT